MYSSSQASKQKKYLRKLYHASIPKFHQSLLVNKREYSKDLVLCVVYRYNLYTTKRPHENKRLKINFLFYDDQKPVVKIEFV
jgi:hypothetical protein